MTGPGIWQMDVNGAPVRIQDAQDISSFVQFAFPVEQAFDRFPSSLPVGGCRVFCMHLKKILDQREVMTAELEVAKSKKKESAGCEQKGKPQREPETDRLDGTFKAL